MTGLHGLHVIIGMIIIGVVMVFIKNDKITNDNYVKLENAGLYWHLVDLIWIFLFPLFYLIQ
jgi:cytochrome c oxidase subunit 3